MKKKSLLLSLGYIVLLSAYLLAIETGEIQGKVSDENGVGLPGVEIIARSPGLQGTRTVLSTKARFRSMASRTLSHLI